MSGSGDNKNIMKKTLISLIECFSSIQIKETFNMLICRTRQNVLNQLLNTLA